MGLYSIISSVQHIIGKHGQELKWGIVLQRGRLSSDNSRLGTGTYRR